MSWKVKQHREVSSGMDVMIDLETLAANPNAVIVSLAAVKFDIRDGSVGESFYKKIDIESCLNSQMNVDASTITWWMQQSDEARKQFVNDGDRFSIVEALIELSMFIESEDFVWGNGAAFDLAILREAYRNHDIDLPWKHWNERDVRTLVSLAPHIKDQELFTGTKHDPLSDCLHQIKYCCKTFEDLKG